LAAAIVRTLRRAVVARGEVSASAPASTRAIRIAAKIAIDTGDLPRARALFDLLDAKPKPAPVLTLAER
jgi:hypothetical protein